MTVKACRLSSGEDIIANIEVHPLGYSLVNPAQIIIQQTEDGRVGAAFAPFAPFAKDNTVIMYKAGIIGEMEIDIKMINEYNRIFGAGIVIAAANEIPQSIIQ